jgi:brefeldin A-inhibited guanine nucleotide-exchange protein
MNVHAETNELSKVDTENGGGKAVSPEDDLNKSKGADEDLDESKDEKEMSLAAIYRKDAYLCIRFLCRLSVREDGRTGDKVDSSSPMWRARIISLELILFILNNSGPELHTHRHFVTLIRKALCSSILKNGVSTDALVFELCISIFLNLIRHYRKPLKSEIEVIFNQIYLRILDLLNSPTQQKVIVLECLQKVCSTPQILFDIYLNYDCDLAMVSIFERMVQSLSRILQTPMPQKITKGLPFVMAGLLSDSSNDDHVDEEILIRGKALNCLIAIVVSLDSWLNSHATAPARSSNSGGSRMNSDPDISNMEDINLASGKEKAGHAGDSEVLGTGEEVARGAPLYVMKNHISSVWLDENHSSIPGSPGLARLSLSTSGAASQVVYQEASSRKQLWRQAITKFNLSPTKGIKMLVENGFFVSDALDCAKFLISTPDLNKRAIGEYLGEGDAFCIKVMHCFIDSMDFTGKSFVTALRQFLKTFRLPGEAQKIDRIMEKFAHRYCINNPDMFADADTAYTLAFSIIMLNTDQHSTRVKNKMDEAAFIKNNRGIDNNGDLPTEFLAEIFKDISTKEIVMDDEDMAKVVDMNSGPATFNAKQQQAHYQLEMVI